MSFWIQFNPAIKIDHTLKKYFNKYLYKLVIYCPAGRLIDSDRPMCEALDNRKSLFGTHRHGLWADRLGKDLESADPALLEALHTIKYDSDYDIKVRIEEPNIQIYANEESTLIDLVNTYFSKFDPKHVELISGPGGDSAQKILESGAIIRRTDNGYRYKIIIRDGMYSVDVKESILSYLLNLDQTDVLVPKSCFKMLRRPSGYIWNLYLYANDPSITAFLDIIYPGLVLKCHELVTVPHK